ncbi:MAG TPA: hypothetical protein VFO19_19940, partial [Vicinamibacterales bacterium]|nr:hypothetical protein [Vicinamibacterales bacterium]
TLAVGARVALSVADRRANLQSPLARAISAVTRIDRPLEPSALPVIDATPPRPAPAPQPGPRTVGERKPMLRRVRHPDRTAPASPKLIRRMPTDGSSDPRRRNSH